jgi:lactoylglutathione lyase
MELSLKRIQHIGIPVTDMHKSVAFYERLGFRETMQAVFSHKGAQGQVKMMEQGDIILELYQMPPDELPKIRDRNDGHIDHIAFDVDDIDKAFKTIRGRGFTTLEEEPVFLPFWEKGCKFFHILGPDGERLEFNQVV